MIVFETTFKALPSVLKLTAVTPDTVPDGANGKSETKPLLTASLLEESPYIIRSAVFIAVPSAPGAFTITLFEPEYSTFTSGVAVAPSSILIPSPASIPVTSPVADIVTAPVDPLIDILEPATMLVTPVFVIVNVFGVAEATAVLIPVPPVKSTLNPSVISTAEPLSASKLQEVYAPAGVAHTLSPLKNLVALGVPVAERSAVVVIAPEVEFELCL